MARVADDVAEAGTPGAGQDQVGFRGTAGGLAGVFQEGRPQLEPGGDLPGGIGLRAAQVFRQADDERTEFGEMFNKRTEPPARRLRIDRGQQGRTGKTFRREVGHRTGSNG